MDKKKEKEMDATERVARKLICWDYKIKRIIKRGWCKYWHFLTKGKACYVLLVHLPFAVIGGVGVYNTLPLPVNAINSSVLVFVMCVFIFGLVGISYGYALVWKYLSDVKSKMKLEKEC